MEIQRLIGRSLRAVTDLDALGERTLWIDCDVLQADSGGTRCAAIGAYVASRALDRRPRKGLTDSVAGVSRDRRRRGAPRPRLLGGLARRGRPQRRHERRRRRLIEVQATAEGERYTREQLDELLDLAAAGIEQIGEAQQRAVEAVLA